MNKIKLMDRVLFALSVPKCVGCGERLNYGEKALCLECSAVFDDFKTRTCSKCAKVLSECSCTNSYLKAHFVSRVIKCFRYLNRENSTPGNSLIYSLKKDNRKDVLEVCAKELAEAISNSIDNPAECIFTNVPRRRAAIIEHGIDHSGLLTRAVADMLGAEYITILKSNAKKAQRSLEAMDRLRNADFDIIKEIDLGGREVIIVDDIITTGASMSAAAALIRSLGCKNITAACLAIAYKDD